MWGYYPSPEDELVFLERYKRILELRYKLLEAEISYLDEKLSLIKEFLSKYPKPEYRNISWAWEYPPLYQVPLYQYPPIYQPYPYKPTEYAYEEIPISSGKSRVVVATQGSRGLDDIVSPIFARTPFFTIIDLEDGEVRNVEVIENRFGMMGGGAGIAAAQYMKELNADIVIAGSFGPNSQGMLENIGIKTLVSSPVPVRELLKRFRL